MRGKRDRGVRPAAPGGPIGDSGSAADWAGWLTASEDHPSNPDPHDPIGEVVGRRLSRRAALRRLFGVGLLGSLPATALCASAATQRHAASTDGRNGAGFTEIRHGVDSTHHVAPGYRAEVLIRWGDPVLDGAPGFDPRRPARDAQRGQFGYNNDFVGYVPLPFGSNSATHGLLCVNHEYTNARMMFPRALRTEPGQARELAEIEMAAHGGSVIEVRQSGGRWQVVAGSRYARRINALDTPVRIGGPAAGHRRMRTGADPAGTQVIGTLNNCAGGITPWGTWLMAEENFNQYFSGDRAGHPEAAHLRRYGVPGAAFRWSRHHPRFDIAREPNEPNRFGWIVEVDPLDPGSPPVKRTALGRFKHEGAACVVNGDGRLVVYSGDDQQFEFLYRFVSRDPVDTRNRSANRDLLEHGTLYAARFADDGTLHWLPLVHGEGGLDRANGFHDQGDVLIEARRAAALLGATPLDRPEDVEPDPVTGRVYLMLTGHSQRAPAQVDAANPRADNRWGHVIELTTPDGDHAAAMVRWEILVRAGDPRDPATRALWHPDTSEHGWFACPDNAAIDPAGRLWVCTDQASAWPYTSDSADGLWTLATAGPARGTGRMFFRVPIGAEPSGPCFTPDGRTLFLSVQHPGESGGANYLGIRQRSTFDEPATRWPDFEPAVPPRPSVVVITKDDGGTIGS